MSKNEPRLKLHRTLRHKTGAVLGRINLQAFLSGDGTAFRISSNGHHTLCSCQEEEEAIIQKYRKVGIHHDLLCFEERMQITRIPTHSFEQSFLSR